ncbi:hypothetical protein I0600191H4_16150 [Collinsella sp. i06-0019-1H4]
MGTLFGGLPDVATVGPLARVSYLLGPCNVYNYGVLFELPLGTVFSDIHLFSLLSPKGAFLCLN